MHDGVVWTPSNPAAQVDIFSFGVILMEVFAKSVTGAALLTVGDMEECEMYAWKVRPAAPCCRQHCRQISKSADQGQKRSSECMVCRLLGSCGSWCCCTTARQPLMYCPTLWGVPAGFWACMRKITRCQSPLDEVAPQMRCIFRRRCRGSDCTTSVQTPSECCPAGGARVPAAHPAVVPAAAGRPHRGVLGRGPRQVRLPPCLVYPPCSGVDAAGASLPCVGCGLEQSAQGVFLRSGAPRLQCSWLAPYFGVGWKFRHP